MNDVPDSSHFAAPHTTAQRADELLGNFARLFVRIPSGWRGAALRTLLAFDQPHDWETAYSIGELRAAFAEWWEIRFEEAFPIGRVRDQLATPVPVGLALRFGRFIVVHDLDEMLRCLADFSQFLFEKTRPADRQLRLLEEEIRQPDVESTTTGRTVASLEKLVTAGDKFRTVYADPPWSYSNRASNGAAENHYPTMTVDEICAQPINELTAEDAHLHLWTTNSFLREALQVVDAWGFKYKSCFVWVKPQMGMGNYWRVSHEFLFLGVKGKLTFTDHSQRSWLEADRVIHSRKPDAIRSLIELVSPGPYIELYGREELCDSAWTVYGNQVEGRLF